jgi:hypothetical protein
MLQARKQNAALHLQAMETALYSACIMLKQPYHFGVISYAGFNVDEKETQILSKKTKHAENFIGESKRAWLEAIPSKRYNAWCMTCSSANTVTEFFE